MAMLSLKNIDKSFSGVQVLFNISTDIEDGKVTAVIGENGAGKSTLMNIAGGAISEYSGTIILNGKELKFRSTRDANQNGITIIHQELNILPDLTAGENIFLGREPLKYSLIDYNKLYEESDQILKQFKFPYPSDIKMRRLSVGWQQIVEIARALTLNAQIIIMDEPTSALSENETQILFEKIRYLRDEGKTILFISHRISEVLEISDNIIVLRDGKVSASVKTKETTREALIRYMAGEKTAEAANSYKINSLDEILKLENISAEGGSVSLSDINFALHKGEVLGIAGLLGSGRTELLKFIFGEPAIRYQGKIFFRKKEYSPSSAAASIKNGIIYLPENRKEEGIFADHSLRFNAGVSVLEKYESYGLLDQSRERKSVEEKFNYLSIKRNSTDQKIRTLSGGNQQKVLLSRILLTDPEIILLDDPTRGIDISSKEEIYELIGEISSKGISIIITSSEIPELLQLCSRILILSNGKQTALFNTSEKNAHEILKYAFKQL